ncbi:MAG: hypothetical protein ACLFOY_16640 [Desulfatibacillaceae bacterium]
MDYRQTQQPDRRLRKIMLGVLAALTVAGAAGILWGGPMLAKWLGRLDTREALLFMDMTLTLWFFALIPFAAYFYRLGVKTARDKRFPPHGVRVIRETSIVVGDEAMRRARLLKAFAVCLFVLAVGASLYLHVLVSRLARAL